MCSLLGADDVLSGVDDVLSLGTDDVVGQLLRSERSRHAQHADGGSVNPLA